MAGQQGYWAATILNTLPVVPDIPFTPATATHISPDRRIIIRATAISRWKQTEIHQGMIFATKSLLQAVADKPKIK